MTARRLDTAPPPPADASDARAERALSALFETLLETARRDPDFAERLVRRIEAALAPAESAAPPPPPPARSTRRPAADPTPALHAVNVLRADGEGFLRGRLEQLPSRAALRAAAARSGLVLSGKAARARASRAELIEGVIAAAREYDAQRREAAR